MRVRVHRGAAEIGGNCVEVEAVGGGRIVLDLGRPLWAGFDDVVELPDVAGLRDQDASLLGIVVSHPHLDHYGLLAEVAADVPVFIGEEAAAVISAASFFSTAGAPVSPVGFLRHRQPIRLGPFTVTPFLNDHSAFDAYSLLVEADGERLFYSGDFRGHGRKSSVFEELLADPPSGVDVLLMEGTHVRRDGADDEAGFDSESDLEDRFVEVCIETEGAVVVLGSAQNLDRLVTVFRAARRSGRELVIDLYGASVAAASRSTIPQPGFDGLRVWVPQRQRVLVKESGEFWRMDPIRDCRVFLEELGGDPARFVFHVAASTIPELLGHGVLDQRGMAVWSMWEGYMRKVSGERTLRRLADSSVDVATVHTSGHASVGDLRRLADAVNPVRLVPVHSEAAGRFTELFDSVELHNDGEWWEVNPR